MGFITADQILIHMLGDYILQSHEMAQLKTKSSIICLIHVLFYTLSFTLLTFSLKALFFIAITHFFIDRFRLARYIIFAKNVVLFDEPHCWQDCSKTGFHRSTPDWLAVWLMIIVDNFMHIVCNGFALKFLN